MKKEMLLLAASAILMTGCYSDRDSEYRTGSRQPAMNEGAGAARTNDLNNSSQDTLHPGAGAPNDASKPGNP